ncbi:MAG: hypothetical protein ACRENB_10775 [Gemmatimonadales bacterium]
MRTQAALLVALLFPVGLPAQSHPTSRALDPVGTYDVDLEMHGQTTGSVLVISRGEGGKLAATLEVHGQTITFTEVTVDGRKVELSAGPDLTLTLAFKTDSSFGGQWTRAEASGGLAGIRRKH